MANVDKRTLEIVAEVKDLATKEWRRLKGETSRTSRAMERAWKGVQRVQKRVNQGLRSTIRQVRRMGIVAAGVIGLLGGLSVRASAQFETGQAQISTLVDTSVVDMERLKEGVLAVGRETGDAFDPLNKSLFDLISATGDAEGGLASLLVGSKLAIGGGTDTATAVDALTSIMGAYGKTSKDALDISDSLFQAMKGGKVTIAELAGSIGKMSGNAAQLGLSVDDLTAGFAALTISVPVEEAATGFAAFMRRLLDPAAQSIPVIQELKREIREGDGLAGVLRVLQRAQKEYGDELVSFFPNARAQKALFALLASDGQNLTRVLGTMANKAGATEEAFAKMRATLGNQFQRFLRTLETLFIRVGDAAKPFIEDALGGLERFVGGLSERRGQIEAVVGLIGGLFGDVANVVRTAFARGDIATLMVNAIAAGVQGMVSLFIDAVPLMARTAALIGREAGAALVRSFIGSTKEALAKQLAQGGLTTDLLARAGLGGRAADRLKVLGKELLNIEETLKSPLFRGTPLKDVDLSVDSTGFPVLAELQKLKRQRATILSQIAGTDDRSAIEGIRKQLAADAAALVDSAGEAVTSALARLGVGLDRETKTAIGKIGERLTRFRQEFALGDSVRNLIEGLEGERVRDVGIGEGAAIGFGGETERQLAATKQAADEAGHSLREFEDEAESAFQAASAGAESVERAMSGGLALLLESLIDKTRSLKDAFRDLVDSMLRDMVRLVSDDAARQFLKFLGGLLGGSTGDIVDAGVGGAVSGANGLGDAPGIGSGAAIGARTASTGAAGLGSGGLELGGPAGGGGGPPLELHMHFPNVRGREDARGIRRELEAEEQRIRAVMIRLAKQDGGFQTAVATGLKVRR